MDIDRFVETSDGGSRFTKLAIPFPDAHHDGFGNSFRLTRALEASAVLVEIPQGIDQDWHPAPTRQLVFVLQGRMEVETSDGETRRWGPGDLLLADDVASRGHRTRVLEGPARLLFLRLGDDDRLDRWVQT